MPTEEKPLATNFIVEINETREIAIQTQQPMSKEKALRQFRRGVVSRPFPDRVLGQQVVDIRISGEGEANSER